MTNVHPSELELQQYALDKSACAKPVIDHIDDCPECQVGAAAYRLLFEELPQQPKPAFDFDVAALVLPRLRTESTPIRADRYARYFLIAIILPGAGIPAWLFRKSAFYVFTGVPTLFLSLILAAATLIVAFRVSAMYRKYQRRMQALQFY